MLKRCDLPTFAVHPPIMPRARSLSRLLADRAERAPNKTVGWDNFLRPGPHKHSELERLGESLELYDSPVTEYWMCDHPNRGACPWLILTHRWTLPLLSGSGPCPPFMAKLAQGT